LVADATQLTTGIVTIGFGHRGQGGHLWCPIDFMAVMDRIHIHDRMLHGHGLRLGGRWVCAATSHGHPSTSPKPQGHQAKQEAKEQAVAHLSIIGQAMRRMQPLATSPQTKACNRPRWS
jgi:hypothetical protein